MTKNTQYQVRATPAGRAAFAQAKRQTRYKPADFFDTLMRAVAACIAAGHDVDEIAAALEALAAQPAER